MATIGKGRNRKFESLEKLLQSRRSELRNHISKHMGDVHMEHEPDDEAAFASESVTADLAVATLERERRQLEEIENALDRMKRGTYGICGFCETPIPEARLQALPWARLCIHCAGGSVNRSSAAAD